VSHPSSPPWMQSVHLTVLRARLRPNRAWTHTEPALALRGALGAAMVHLLCTQDRFACPPCLRKHTCLLPQWYDPGPLRPAAPRPFWLRCRAHPGGRVDPDRPLDATWTFAGPVPRPSLVEEALHVAAARGLGEERVPHDVEVDWRTPEGWSSAPAGPVPLDALVDVPPPDARVVLRTVTRLRLRRDGRVLRAPALSEVVASAVQRLRALAPLLGTVAHVWPAPEPGGPLLQARWEDGGRWSERQGRPVDLAGAQGAWLLEPGSWLPWRDVLAAAEVLQLGHGTSAGLGVVRLSFD